MVLKDEHSLSVDELRQYCQNKLAKFMVPNQIEFIVTMPLTPTGKPAKLATASSSYTSSRTGRV